MTPTADLHKENVYLCTRARTHTHAHIIGKDTERRFIKKERQLISKTRKKCSTSLAAKLIKFKTTTRYFSCVRLANIFKEAMSTVQGTVCHTSVGTTGQTTAGQSLVKPQATAQVPPRLSLWPQEAMTGHLERNFNYLVVKSG